MIPRKPIHGIKKEFEAHPDKFQRVMMEFKHHKLHSSSGELVSNPKQAVAIAYSESRRYGKGHRK